MSLSVRLVIAAVCILAALLRPDLAAQSPQVADFNAFPVQGNVSVLIGPEGLGGATPNITVQASADAVVLVDTGRGDANERALAAIRRISSRPVRFIINTHADVEHTGGNQGLARSGRPYGGRAAGAGFLLADQSAGATIIAHENVLTALSGARGGPAAPFAMLPTETYFTSQHELYNDEAIQLFHEAAAHSDGDSIVFFRRSDVISTGDIFSTVTYPRVNLRAGGTVDGIIRALNHVIDLAVPRDKQEGGTYIIPGHGRVCDEADVVEYRDMLVIIRDRVRDLATKGRTLDQIKAAKVTVDYDRRYATSGWTGEQLVESIVAGPPPTGASSASGGNRGGRQ
jgi:cyclase